MREFNPNDPRLLGGLTLLHLLVRVAEFLVGAAGGFYLSFLLWIYLPTHVIPLLGALGAVASMGAFLVAQKPARVAGAGWMTGLAVTLVGAMLALHTAYSW